MKPRQMRIAVLMACFNRRPKTLSSLENLFTQVLEPEISLDVYLLDDASTDGTAAAVRKAYPQVKILQGSGSLFWNGGMRRAFAAALKSDYAYYLWLNDDTILYSETVGKLLSVSQQLIERGEERAIVAGAVCDPMAKTLTYSGLVRSSWWHPLKFSPVEPGETVKLCDTMHGNCVLIPRSVAQVVGNMDENFTHYAGDLDYGLRAKQKGCTVWLAPEYVGTCPINSPQGSACLDRNLSFKDRLAKIFQPKGLPPKEWRVFSQHHAGFFWPFYWILPYVRLFVLSVMGRVGERYDDEVAG